MTHMNIYPIGSANPLHRQRWPENDPIPEGFTALEPPAPIEGHTVQWDGEAWVQVAIPEPEPDPVPEQDDPLRLQQRASARLTVNGFEVHGIERSEGFGMAFMLDENTVWAFFEKAQPDTDYIAMPAEGITKHQDFVEVALNGRPELAFIIFRIE